MSCGVTWSILSQSAMVSTSAPHLEHMNFCRRNRSKETGLVCWFGGVSWVKKHKATSNKQQGKRNEKKPMILFFDNHVIVRICSSCSPVVLFLFMENAWKCVNVVKSNQFTNQTNPENQENALCNLPCGAMPPHFNGFQFHCTCATVGLDICGIKRWYHDIMSAACSREQFYLKKRSDRTMLVLCWYPSVHRSTQQCI